MPDEHLSLLMSDDVETVRSPFLLPVKKKRDVHHNDFIFSLFLKGISLLLPLLLFFIALFLYKAALPTLHKFGWSFLFTSVWDPVQEIFGAAPVIFGTLVTSFIAVALGGPISVSVALLLNEVLPPSVSKVMGFMVEMLAAIPSVVYGLWGIFVLAPWLRISVEPFLSKILGFVPLFQGPRYGVGLLAAGIILAIMITPTITSITREVFRAIPRGQREAALAIGATRWEVMRLAVLKSSQMGIFGATILGLGRALGETMAVTMVIGNRAAISSSLFSPAQTMSSVIANEYAEATSDMHLSALIQIGLTLFMVTLVINGFARVIVWRASHRGAH